MISFQREQLFLVTGASSGIGRATALLLSELGASVIAMGRSSLKLEETKQLSSCPEAVHLYPYDLCADPETLFPLVKKIKEDHGKLAGMCSCAGRMYMDGLSSFALNKCEDSFALHTFIPLLLARAVVDRRHCIGAGTSLVFVSALGGVEQQSGLLSYGAAKAAQIATVKNLSKELGPRKIRVNSVSPALVRTPMTEKDYCDFMGYDVLAAEASHFPLGIGQPEDVASAIVFLLSPRSGWITGQNIILDGGRY